MEIYPVINVPDFESARLALEKVRGFSQWVHLDVSDACFTFNKSWGNTAGWKTIAGDINLEVHLMVEHPERIIEDWLHAGARRIIVHLETVDEKIIAELLLKVKGRATLMIAISPETPAHALEPLFDSVDEFQILAVTPGLSGQKFLPLVLEKIKFLRREKPNARIEVDGGITKETGKMAKDAGASVLVSASYILGSIDPQEAYRELTTI